MALGGEYSYAGLVGTDVATGVRASLVALDRPEVERGHVAAWVGVGGRDVGPDGEDEWIQVGLASFEGSTTRLYYEVMHASGLRDYVEVDVDVRVGEARRVAVLEMVARPRHWRVWVDGRPITQPIELHWSHRSWEPVATAESWSDEGSSRANRFRFAFRELAFRGARRVWRRFRDPYVLVDKGFAVRRSSPHSFRAVAAGTGGA
jgi:hypothetical protein